MTISCKSGPDHLCSDGFCYTGNKCPNGTTIVNNATCSCGNGCSGTCPDTCTSSLQVKNILFSFYINLELDKLS